MISESVKQEIESLRKRSLLFERLSKLEAFSLSMSKMLMNCSPRHLGKLSRNWILNKMQ